METYKIVIDGGTIFNSSFEMESNNLGLIPKNTIVTIEEKKTIKEDVARLRISLPIEYKGWISDISNICCKVTQSQQRNQKSSYDDWQDNDQLSNYKTPSEIPSGKYNYSI
jgi:hypothetical protein